VDVAAATRDALRFPLSGPTLERAVTPGGRATIAIDHPSLPLPPSPHDPRPDALAATIDELAAAGIPESRQTILVAGGLERRLGQRELERFLPPPRARSFRGRVVVHDAEDETLVPAADGTRINRELLETDLVVVVSAAETVLHGGPAVLAAACDAATVRGLAAAHSLVEAAGAGEWERLLRIEAAVAASAPVLGVSLVLELPRSTGTFRDFPSDPGAVRHLVRSPFRKLHERLPGFVRRDIIASKIGRLGVIAAFGGAPSVSHAEALLRGVELRGARLGEPVDALVAGVPWIAPHVPREGLNPVTSATVALGLSLRLYRDAFPVRADGTLILVHSLTRSFAHGAGDPFAVMFGAVQDARDDAELHAAQAHAAADERAIAAYRAGKACHPQLPFADWAGCQPALSRLGRVVVAGSRDATAARALGFVPAHGVASALDMAHGVAGGRARVGVLLTPPYAPLLVGS
jgi:hypothetical protein